MPPLFFHAAAVFSCQRRPPPPTTYPRRCALNILENVSDAVYAFDKEWRFAYANGPGIAMARLPEDRLLGGEFWTLFPEPLGGREEINLRAVMSEGGSRRFEYFYPPYSL